MEIFTEEKNQGNSMPFVMFFEVINQKITTKIQSKHNFEVVFPLHSLDIRILRT